MQKMRSEMLLREANYNKTFSNGGLGERVLNVGAAMNTTSQVTSWMLKSKKTNGKPESASSRRAPGPQL